jgi:hypothetical protein
LLRVPHDQVYDLIFYVLAMLLVAGLICNALIGPVHARWHMKEEGGAALAGHGKAGAKVAYGIGRGRFDAQVLVAWTAVGLLLGWGVWKTIENVAKIFQ